MRKDSKKVMGCIHVANKEVTTDEYGDEEKEMKAAIEASGDDELPTMQTNALKTAKQNTLITITSRQPPDHSQESTHNVSPLNNINGYNHSHNQSPHNCNTHSNNQSPKQTLSPYQSRDTSPVELIDNQGNVHANKYYNVTRNHNLSNASKMSNMSEMPSIYQVNGIPKNSLSTTIQSRNFGNHHHIVPPVGHGYQPQHKSSNLSNATDVSRMLWDFGDQGSMMTLNSDVSEIEPPQPASVV